MWVGVVMAGSSDNDYGCPDAVYKLMYNSVLCTQLLRAVRSLGPTRVRWYSETVPIKGGERQHCPVAWCLDGEPTTERKLLDAAKSK